MLPCRCLFCGNTFHKSKNEILDHLSDGRKHNGTRRRAIDFCSRKCRDDHKNTTTIVPCRQCSKNVKTTAKAIRRSKSGNIFCSKSCAAKWNNAHKTKGTRVSKLERWLAQVLPGLYPRLEFHFNRTDAINGELDIYVPSLRLAFELNGVYHYEPIHGPEKLASIRSNDERKFQACVERGIELCIIDVSTMEYFKPARAQRFLGIISNIINTRLSKTNNWSG